MKEKREQKKKFKKKRAIPNVVPKPSPPAPPPVAAPVIQPPNEVEPPIEHSPTSDLKRYIDIRWKNYSVYTKSYKYIVY